MNDSFLEDLKLVVPDPKPVTTQALDRHVTTRIVTSSPIQLSENKLQNLLQKRGEYATSNDKHSSKEISPKDVKRISERDAQKQQMKVKVPERKERSMESKLKPIVNRVSTERKELEIKDDIKKKLERETKLKINENKVSEKDRTRRSGSCKENNHASSKENSHPSDSSKEGPSQAEVCKEKGKKCNGPRKSDIKENDPVVLLNAFKDIVSTYTKNESTKILKAMQELHVNSQANLIRELMFQTDDLLKKICPTKDPSKIKVIIDQNERLWEEVIILQRRNRELQKRLEEFDVLKQENIALKVKCKELSKP